MRIVLQAPRTCTVRMPRNVSVGAMRTEENPPWKRPDALSGSVTAPARSALCFSAPARGAPEVLAALGRGLPASSARGGAMSGAAAAGGGSVGSVVRRFLAEYSGGTASRLKVLDAYLLYVLLSGALQFGYCLGVGTFPFNSFLSGFISAVGSFILGVCLRIQINPQNKGDFQGISPERAFADFLFASTILHLVVINFVG
ncbi:dolichyl-diphosphooligosaccharide--protein glycosyltransferase subunit DAD1 [Dermochelys coriacea]|uniref:dolichyl-diphosphooligosaccharide--protein glycosyltransferase subunit DAD1 n=1 Tax=Dermochelys coriacea TaxID=27794 RepID=UPI0018E71521|nr:dolichyl-diphosphooligosaccharide--protein glycosyltransferase subunit DAD1 [Dermochelys coriacea]